MVAILEPEILPAIRLTVDEYLSAELPEGYRYELVEGVVQMGPVPCVPHDRVIDRLNKLFVQYWLKRPDLIEHITQRSAVTLIERQTAREPDFAIYKPGVIAKDAGRSWKAVTPLLVVEVVSTGQEDRDYEDKPRDYWDAGVGEYWIVDPSNSTLTVFTREATTWSIREYSSGDVYEPAQFPALSLHVNTLFN